MTYLEKLLDGAEVKWKSLGEVVSTVTAPVKLNKNTYGENGKIPVIDQGMYFIAGYTDQDLATVKEGEYVIFGDHSEHIKYVDFSFIQGADGLKILKSKENNTKFIYYALNNFYRRENNYKRHWSSAKETLIPIPPLEIQQKIVAILDSFTKLTDELTYELTYELTARKKQYEFYRAQLLSLEDGDVEWKPLGDVYKFQYGKGNTIPTLGGQYPVYGSNGIVGSHSEYNSEDSPVIGHIGAYAGIVNYGKGKHFVTYNGVICKLINENVNSRYGYYQLINQDFNSLAKNSSQPFVSYKELNSVKVPIPSIEVQERIVSILDKFSTLEASIREGLPKEIELRKKQYEFYRDMLLSFPK